MRGLLIAAAVGLIAVDAPVDRAAKAEILAHAGQYVIRLEQSFAVVIGDEHYEQRLLGPAARGAVRDRRLRSELLFLWLDQEARWLTVRNVLAVDQHPVPDSGQRLESALAEYGGGIARLRRLRDEGARFNLGDPHRNFNDPMLALQFLEPASQHRFVFAILGGETLDGIPTRRLVFTEQVTPSIIQDNGEDRPSRGAVWIADDGAVLRTRLEVSHPATPTTAAIVVDYRLDPRLDIRVPLRMHETYTRTQAGGANGGVRERIDCTATYSNFRRFETSARIVK